MTHDDTTTEDTTVDNDVPFTADLTGRTAVVTGASSGIGHAIADLYLRNGATVVGIHRRKATEHTGRYVPVVADLGDPAQVRAAAAEVLRDHRVDILVNNAGLNLRHPVEDFPVEDWDRVQQLNVRTVVELTQAFGRPMLERGSGVIINLASMLSFTGGFTASAYAASKGAVGQFTKSVANEWAPKGVRVNAIAPGFIATEMNTALVADETRNRQILERIPAGRWGTAQDIAGAALFLASDGARFIHGTVIPVDGGYLGR
ncbi:2-deoxy-D-gluconate 3-dehydrogenase (2-keto-3-deoxygluconate oxidoreductase) [Streptomyces himastatinicus ATCC 53653]|uniref:2-deoxy-D-gluconate 3-dehydrogenase (2-keto-3-deoxygluconate oxidoreductase) n=1 Tax=Streptomyces himastatinicus ATCC 53653 TaxID=457427 RepID=D9WML4_9ACTN|nr:glucose 1-dehydrogenase [Streptomyces himastatinicus]EFL27880.1 2-deoxy-D-gluconate 3-dehydrogenase (2-keto-3-deoxygluconate oxidoreductase) [Streptomyces himastatinicus ATCC 53653]